MPEIIKIKNFGPILNSEIVLRKVNILIGDQGTGKSTIAKILVSIQNTFFRELFNLELNKDQGKETQLFVEYLRIVDIYSFIQFDTQIYYDHPLFIFEYKDSNVAIRRKRELTIQDSSRYDLNYIPAERSSITVLSNSLFALIETGTSLPRLFLRFGDKFLKARKAKATLDYSEIIGVKFLYSNENDLIELPSGKIIPFTESSSGIQSSITLLAVYDSMVKSDFSNENISFTNDFLVPIIIEEPEISCFPYTQYKLLDHIVSNLSIKTDGKSIYKNQLIITTHSPYILTSLNNLMYAYEVGQTEPVETNKIIDKKYWINPDDVSAYMLLNDGTSEDILDRAEKLIRAEKIDSVSGFLNEQFDALLNIELLPK